MLNAIDSRLNCDTDLSEFVDVVTDDGESETIEEELADGTYASDVVVSWDDRRDVVEMTAVAFVDEDGDVLARFDRGQIRRALRDDASESANGDIHIAGDAGATHASLRVRGIGPGRLRVQLRATRLRGRAKERIVTQVSESRRRR